MNQNNDLMNSNNALEQELGDLIRATYNEYNGQYNLQAALENATTDIIPIMELPMRGEFEMNQNNDFMNNNSAIQQAMDELAMISETYNEYNGQYNLQGSLENPTAEIITIMEPSPMMGEFVMNQNNILVNN